MTTALSGLHARLQTRYRAWIARRIPAARSVTLDQKRIFIFPSRVGLFFALCLALMLLTAVNYQNNMSYAITFLLTTLFIVAVLHTYSNLSGLRVQGVHAQSGFPGQQVVFELILERRRRQTHYALLLKWPNSSEALVNLVDEDSERIQLHVPLGSRGWYHPGRLLIESRYPLGLLRCWTHIDLDLQALVYPKPEPCQEPAGADSAQPDGAAGVTAGQDDFHGFRPYREGDSLRRLYWKGLARGQSLQTKQYTAYADRSLWLDWELFPGLGVERRLSQLCYLALECERNREEYGLRLPGLSIDPGAGNKHRDRVLKALALHGIAGGNT